MPVQLNQKYFYHHVTPEIIDMAKTCTFGILNSNFGSKVQLRLKPMVVAYAVVAPAVIVE